jgi:CubicO group peptidase (beta-lactamase class C family)
MKTYNLKQVLIFVIFNLCYFSLLSCYCQIANIDSIIKRTITDYSIPGLAIGIVKSDTFLFEKGYGYKEIETKTLVDENTNFYIASLTKAMTAYGIGILADSKKLSWDDPISKYLRTIRFKESYSNMVTISDVLSMNLGSPYLDTLFYYHPELSKIQIHNAICQHHLPNFRNSNFYGQGASIGFYIAGEIITVVSGYNYKDFINYKLFKPLQMNNTFIIDNDTLNKDLFASPYVFSSKKLLKTDYPKVGQYLGAIGAVSNVHDMTKWLQLLLGIDFHNTLLSNESLNTILFPHNILNKNYMIWFNPYASFNLYGYGWVLSEYKEKLLAEHLGLTKGYTCLIAMIPKEKIGIVILTNLTSDKIIEGLRDLKFNILEKLTKNN